MCHASKNANSPRARALLQIGLLCLVLSLVSQSMSLSFGLGSVPLHFLRGFLLGIALVFLFSSARCRRSATPPPAI